jgi:DNA polymerase-3 subunit delta'
VSFRDFIGNAEAVRQLQQQLAADRLPHALLLAGPLGAGKYTLALTVAQTIHCEQPRREDGLPDACGECSNCVRIAEALDLDARIAEAVEAREGLRETDRKDTRILIQPHPDVMILPPDPPQNLVKVDQVRLLIQNVQRMPAEGRRKVYIVSKSVFMKEAANSLLKVLEEPPAYAHIFLLAENPAELLPTIRSRVRLLHLHPMRTEELEILLARKRPDWKPRERALAARLAEGAVGRALALDLGAYLTTRKDALLLLHTALAEPDYSALFRTTEGYRAGAEGQQKTQTMLRALTSLLHDLMLVLAGAPEQVRNLDIAAELQTMAQGVSLAWIEQATQAIAQAESGMRRNLLRSLSLDAMAAQMARGA